MELTDLLSRQQKLNQLIGSYPATREQLSFALMEESGNVTKALRKEWRWWTWDGKSYEFSRENLIEELNNVFKYLLVGIVTFASYDDTQDAVTRWGTRWKNRGESTVNDVPRLLSDLITDFVIEAPGEAIDDLIQVCVALDISKQELEDAYLKKWRVNIDRVKADKE